MQYRIIVSTFCACAAMAAAAASVDVPVSAVQDWPWSAKVRVDVTMPSGVHDLDLVAEFDYDGARVSEHLMGAAVDGGVFCVKAGAHSLVWDPAAAGYTNRIGNLEISAKAVDADDRAWLVLDCETGNYRFVALGDEESKSAAGWPWNSSNDYRLRYMVFRRIPGGTMETGYTQAEISYLNGLRTSGNAVTDVPSKRSVELTSDYYIGIYQVTVGQCVRLAWPEESGDPGYRRDQMYPSTGDWAGRGYPCFQRGSNSVEGVNWPTTKFRVTPKSQIGRARAKFNNRFMIDLPTVAQWQRAARPDVNWLWYETAAYGGGTTSDNFSAISNIVNTISRGFRSQAQCKAQGYGDVGGYGPVTKAGWFQPNSYGVYDTIANRRELTLDAWQDLTEMEKESTDPVGPSLTGTLSRICVNSYARDGWANPVGFLLPKVNSIANDAVPNGNNEATFRYVIHLNPPKGFGGRWE